MSPFFPGVIIVIGSTGIFLMADDFPGGLFIALMTVGHLLDAVGHLGRDEDIEGVGVIPEDVVRTASHKHTTSCIGGFLDGLRLKLEQALLGKAVGVEIVVTHMLGMHVEQGFEKAPVLIMLLEKFFAETTLLGSQIEQFLVVERTAKNLRKTFGDDTSATAQLAAHIDDDFLLSHDWIVEVVI